MRGPVVWTAVTLSAGALLAAAVPPVSAAPPTAPVSASATPVAARQRHPVLVDCFWRPAVRPRDFILACGDANSLLTGMRWSRWGGASAAAVGVNAVNDCKPYCAAGTFHPYAVTVRLDRPRPWKGHPGLVQYTRMELTYTGAGRPAGYPRVQTYRLWD